MTVTLARYTVARNSAPNLTQACTQEFGPASRQADWQDVKGALGNDLMAVQAFIESNRMVPGDTYLITYGATILDEQGYPYFMTTGGRRGLQKESLAGNLLILNYYRYGPVTGRVVCVNPETVDFPK